MNLSPLAGKPAPRSILIDPMELEDAYLTRCPNADDPAQRVSFGTSGHRGSADRTSFNEAHILAMTQAICDYRRERGISGPIFLGKDTHALSAPAERTAIEVLVGNRVDTIVQRGDGVTPTPVVSRAILVHNGGRTTRLADGIIATPSHNPPADGGFKYNPPNGGPADSGATQWIERRANEHLHDGNQRVRRVSLASALHAAFVHQEDLVRPYVDDLSNVIDMAAIRAAGLKLAVDPLGGAGAPFWEPIQAAYGLDITVVNPAIDPTFSFMTVDHDGQIRMDCSSPYAMARLVELKNTYRLAFGNDADADRHGIVTPSAGLMNPNHYLAVAVDYLLRHRPHWPARAAVGKTVVTSSMVDRVAQRLRRRLSEVPVGFKWFVPGLFDASLCFAGEESAGASFLRRDGTVWTTDKDGLVMNLLAAEITARTGKDPSEHYRALTAELGTSYYARLDIPADAESRRCLGSLAAEAVKADTLAGERITAVLTRAPGNDAPIGGLKVVTENGWFAARPSGTEPIYKVYAESLRDAAHLAAIVEAAEQLVAEALRQPAGSGRGLAAN